MAERALILLTFAHKKSPQPVVRVIGQSHRLDSKLWQ